MKKHTESLFEHGIVADTQDLCGECPLWVSLEQAIYWSDITGKRVYRLAADSLQPQLLRDDLEISGLIPHSHGGFSAVNSHGLWRWDGGMRLDLVHESVDSHTCQLNDCIADARGRVISGSQFFNAHGPYELGKLFLFDVDGSARILEEGLHLSNGLAWSPAGDTLYVTDSVARCIYRYAYNLGTGSVSDRRVLVQVPFDEGMPDGLTTDADGFLWSAQWYGSCVIRYDPDGRKERRILLPAKQTSSVAFGGPNLTDLYITSAAQPEPGPTPARYRPTGYIGGALFRLPTDVQGREENQSLVESPAGQ